MSATNGRVQTQDVEGTVEAVNATGLKLGGAWVNLSKFHPVTLPETGAHIRMQVDSKGYIVSLTNLEQVTGRLPNPDSARITRLTVLKAAANFVGLMSQTREDVKSEHVLALADKWLAWVEERPA